MSDTSVTIRYYVEARYTPNTAWQRYRAHLTLVDARHERDEIRRAHKGIEPRIIARTVTEMVLQEG